MTPLLKTAQLHLQTLCLDIPSRRVGSDGNRVASEFFARTAATFGFAIESAQFECIDWRAEAVQLTADGTSFAAFASPYSLGCRVAGPLAVVETVEALEAADLSDSLVLLRGDIAREQLMPKNFPFYNPESHQHILRLLETHQPPAIIAATTRDVRMVGSLNPFPLIEDGDFNIPSVYMTDVEGGRLADYAGRTITLESRAERIPAIACNVIARKGAEANRRVVFFAHIDAKPGTPGAIDNAGGVTILLLLAELLANYSGKLAVEIVAMNGEDYFSSPGEQLYLSRNAGRFDEILLGVNLDGVGYDKGRTAFSLYGCPAELAGIIRESFADHVDCVEGEPWYQGDHGLFLMNQRPALALTSELALELLSDYIHTPRDRPEIVGVARLVSAARALDDLVRRLDEQPSVPGKVNDE